MKMPLHMPLTWRQSVLPLAFLLAFSLVGTLVTSSQAAPAAKSLRKLEKSAAFCAWAAQNQAKLPIDLTCPALPTQGQSQGQGQTMHTPTTNAAPSQLGDRRSGPVHFGRNVDATNPNEDLASGQSETAIAASGRYVISAWNDATGFLIVDPTAPQSQLTGVGFSSDGGRTFQDVNLPNSNPCQRMSGDPSVVSYQAPDGTTYFYVTSLYFPDFSICPTIGNFEVGMSVGVVPPNGTSISFSTPVVVANGGNFNQPTFDELDKDFAAIDRAHGKIAVSYTAFGFSAQDASGQINVAYCDISSNPAAPTCNPGTGGIGAQVIANTPSNFAEQEGAYPAFSSSGNLYVTWNSNWTTNFFNGDPFTHQLAAWLPASCVAAPPCAIPTAVTIGTPVKSLDATTIAGYNRGIGNDFPRISFNNTTNQVVFVWNEANAHPLGDIVMATASWDLSTVNPKVRVNDDNSFAMHFLPAVSVDSKGDINISWYDRREADGSARTDVFAASIRPGTNGGENSRVTNVATDWNATGSFITPNFGDYTDNTSDDTTFYVNWSDGRIGVPNSFVASASTAQR